jgi:long-chain acyl-CoA synthetase
MVDVYTIKVEEARPATHEKPSAGPVYRCIYAKDGLLELPSHFQSPWDFLRSLLTIPFFFLINNLA